MTAGSASEMRASSRLAVALLDHLERAGGPALVASVMAGAGCRATSAQIRSRPWIARRDLLSLVASAAAQLGDPQVGRRAGEELFRTTFSDPVARSVLQSAGGPRRAFDVVLGGNSALGHGQTYRVVAEHPGSILVESRISAPGFDHPFFCDLAVGFWALLPTLFGSLGTAYHPECRNRGESRCLFVASWDAPSGEFGRETVSAEARDRIKTFEDIQRVAENLARAADLTSLAEELVDAAVLIVPFPEIVAAIRPAPGRPPVVAARGLSRLRADALAREWADGGGPQAGALVVSQIGDLGAILVPVPDASSPFLTALHLPESVRMVEAFGRHAAARVEAVIALQSAEQSRRTAAALLELAAALAETSTEEEVCECLANAIPGLVGADHSTVLRWLPEEGVTRVVAASGPGVELPPPGSGGGRLDYRPDQVPEMRALPVPPAPFVLRRETATPVIAAAMTRRSEEAAIVAPVADSQSLLGLISAGYRDALTTDLDEAFERLKGAAGLAATALGKARLLEAIRHQALHDELTGLPNRTHFENRLRQVLAGADPERDRFGLLFIDLDRFKNVNESMGHEFGDALLKAAAARLSGWLRPGDVMARMGGDEFVVLLDEVGDADEAGAAATRILDGLREPFEIDGEQVYGSASIGVALYPCDGQDYGTLLRLADRSMYAAKDAGRNTFSRSRPVEVIEGSRRLHLETDLHLALDRDELHVVYQPEVALAGLKVVGVEALVRWRHPQMGELAPADFLALAEECGLMPEIDRVVRRKAFAQALEWQQVFGQIKVAVNLSAQSIRRADLLSQIRTDVADSGVDPSGIEFEITEGVVAEDDLGPVVRGLAELGTQVAVDDFGTGASSFSRLQKLPLDTLKIDRSLVSGSASRRDGSILAAIVEMAHTLGLRVVAEGIEQPSQARTVRRFGCDLGQGYLFGRPVSATDLEPLIWSQMVNLERPLADTRRAGGDRSGQRRQSGEIGRQSERRG